MKKRLLILLSALTIICNTVAFASSEPAVTIDKCVLDENYNLIVEARVPGALKKQKIGVICTDPDGNVVFSDQTTLLNRNEAGELTASFYSVKFQPQFKSGDYTVTVSGKGVAKDTDTITYYGVDSWSSALNAVVDADGSAILTAASKDSDHGATNAEILGIDVSLLKSFTKTGEFYALIDNDDAKFSIEGLDPSDEEDALAIQDVVIAFKSLWSEAVRIGEYYNADTAEDVKDWFAKNQKLYDDNPTEENMRFDFNGNDKPETLSEDRNVYLMQSFVLNKSLSAMASADKQDGGNRVGEFYSTLASDKPAFAIDAAGNTWDEATPANAALHAITERLREGIVLSTALYMPSEYLDSILTGASGVVDIDDTKFKSVSDKSALYTGIVGTEYQSLEALADAIDKKLGELTDDSDSGSTGSLPDSSGSNRGGSVATSGGSKTEDAAKEENASGIFADVPAGHWASGAINALFEKGVVNGKGNGIFDPDGIVTRSEFVKMLICAFGFSTDGIECEFSDLTSGMWQYPYIAAASELEIVKGFSDGRFGVNDVITRQDMAVLAERAMRIYGEIITDANADFTDIAQVSDYAQGSVKTLAALGIINGMPDGSFAPHKTVTRAQAASIIYRAISN